MAPLIPSLLTCGRKRSAFLFVLAGFVWTGCDRREPAPSAIVLFIADGTSQELLTAARYYVHGGKGRLAIESMPQSAIVRTVSANSLVTDSSAAATAMARGIKVVNGVVGKAAAGKPGASPSILDLAREAGWSTGVISDDSLAGATPASFLVENDIRFDDFGIADSIAGQVGKRADIILGGGAKFFLDAVDDPSVFYVPGQRRLAARTEKKLRDSGAAVFQDWASCRAFLDAPDGRPVFGVFAPERFPFYADGKRSLRLKDLVEGAVGFLQGKKKPFLLVVEAGLPDKASHANTAKRAIHEVLELDAAVDWVRRHVPGALILVTTDHNTGGLVVNGYPPVAVRGAALFRPDPIKQRPILTWASGPGFQRENERVRITQDPGEPWREVREKRLPGDVDYTEPALIEAGSALHTGGDVWLLGEGPGSGRVRGFLENTDIFHLMADALGQK